MQQSQYSNTEFIEKAKATKVTEKIIDSREAADSIGTSACIRVYLRQNFFLLPAARTARGNSEDNRVSQRRKVRRRCTQKHADVACRPDPLRLLHTFDNCVGFDTEGQMPCMPDHGLFPSPDCVWWLALGATASEIFISRKPQRCKCSTRCAAVICAIRLFDCGNGFRPLKRRAKDNASAISSGVAGRRSELSVMDVRATSQRQQT